MRKIISSFILSILPFLACAENAVLIEGIYYNLIKKANTAEVAEAPWIQDPVQGRIRYQYSGNVTIPNKIVYDGVEYVVKTIGKKAFSGSSTMISITIP